MKFREAFNKPVHRLPEVVYTEKNQAGDTKTLYSRVWRLGDGWVTFWDCPEQNRYAISEDYVQSIIQNSVKSGRQLHITAEFDGHKWIVKEVN